MLLSNRSCLHADCAFRSASSSLRTGPLLRGAGGSLRRLVGRSVLSQCRYAIGWSNGSTEVTPAACPRTTCRRALAGVPAVIRPIHRPDVGERWFSPGSEEYPKLAFVARFSPEKGLEDFLGVAELLADRLDVRVAIAGGESSDPLLNGWIASRCWARAHGVLGRAQVAELLAAADVLVCPSRTLARVKEQFGKAPLEAMAVGTPVFAYDCGALEEGVGDGGVVVDEGSRIALADELERYFRSSEETQRQLSDRARVAASHFTDAALAERLTRLWSDVLAGRV